jgi:hypothetical protein
MTSPPVARPSIAALQEILAQAEKRLAAELRAKEIVDNKSYLLIGGGLTALLFVLSGEKFIAAANAHPALFILAAILLAASAAGLMLLISVVWKLREYGAPGDAPSFLLGRGYPENGEDGYAAMLIYLAADYEERIEISRENNERKIRLYEWGRGFLLPSVFTLLVWHAIAALGG